MIKDKKILFIAPVFHNYHLLIKEKLAVMGADITFFPERKYGFIFRIINNLFNRYLKNYQEFYYRRILKKIEDEHFDYLFVIRGYMLSKKFLDEFKKMNPSAKSILYQWDSNKTNPFIHLLPSFDIAHSFDYDDCDHNPKLNYIPLFFSDDIKNLVKNEKDIEYDFFFMGWCLPERYNAVLKFMEFSAKNGFKLKAFLYLPFSSYIRERIKGSNLDKTIISFRPMSRGDYLSYLKRSKIMVDVSSSNQTGLAMRVIEALASNTKVLTNNNKIKEEDKIYNKDYIAVFDENKPSLDELFLNSNSQFKVKNLLSLEDWLKSIFLIKSTQ